MWSNPSHLSFLRSFSLCSLWGGVGCCMYVCVHMCVLERGVYNSHKSGCLWRQKKMRLKTQDCHFISKYSQTRLLNQTNTCLKCKDMLTYMHYAHTPSVIFKGTQGRLGRRDNSPNEPAWVGDPGACREEWCRHGDVEAKGLSHGVMQVFLEEN